MVDVVVSAATYRHPRTIKRISTVELRPGVSAPVSTGSLLERLFYRVYHMGPRRDISSETGIVQDYSGLTRYASPDICYLPQIAFLEGFIEENAIDPKGDHAAAVDLRDERRRLKTARETFQDVKLWATLEWLRRHRPRELSTEEREKWKALGLQYKLAESSSSS